MVVWHKLKVRGNETGRVLYIKSDFLQLKIVCKFGNFVFLLGKNNKL